jgi:hypothetical protein
MQWRGHNEGDEIRNNYATAYTTPPSDGLCPDTEVNPGLRKHYKPLSASNPPYGCPIPFQQRIVIAIPTKKERGQALRLKLRAARQSGGYLLIQISVDLSACSFKSLVQVMVVVGIP